MNNSRKMIDVKKIFFEKGFTESPWSSTPYCSSLIKEAIFKKERFLITTEISFLSDAEPKNEKDEVLIIRSFMFLNGGDGVETNLFDGLETFLYNRDSHDFIKEKVLSHILSFQKKLT